jgi:hypothetical protein
MAAEFVATKPFPDEAFPAAEKPFPIIEVFGHDKHLATDEARKAFNDRLCPFAGVTCEKYRQYGYGYCSVQYRAEDDDDYAVYAVCDHRLDGVPVLHAVRDYFPSIEHVRLIDELKLKNPSQSFDFIALDTETDDFISIETQAIDIRGGGVGPAWVGILEGEPASWRQRFTDEAKRKRRKKDGIDYGVNTANITKRLGLQIAEKGSLLRRIGSKMYVVTQDRCFRYMEKRIPAEWVATRDDPWDITFMTFDYTGRILEDGKWEVSHVQTKRTTVASFSEALARSTATITREDFLRRVKKKGGLL